jgi:hypothetical protein
MDGWSRESSFYMAFYRWLRSQKLGPIQIIGLFKQNTYTQSTQIIAENNQSIYNR